MDLGRCRAVYLTMQVADNGLKYWGVGAGHAKGAKVAGPDPASSQPAQAGMTSPRYLYEGPYPISLAF